MSRGAMSARVAVQAGGNTPVPVEVRIGWVRCERCQRVFTAVGDHHDDFDDLKAAAAESAETEFDDDGREVCGDCDAEVSRG